MALLKPDLTNHIQNYLTKSCEIHQSTNILNYCMNSCQIIVQTTIAS